MQKFRPLREDEIECRVSRCTEHGVSILLYKTARTDMDLLDETVGPDNWQDDYKEIKGNLYCGIGVRESEDKPFVWKWNCGVESRADGDGNEKKGEASDAFKRAGTCWGIGRELYTSPDIFVPAEKCNIKPRDWGGKTTFTTYDKFYVEKISCDSNRRINGLCIRIEATKSKPSRRVFVWAAQSDSAE